MLMMDCRDRSAPRSDVAASRTVRSTALAPLVLTGFLALCGHALAQEPAKDKSVRDEAAITPREMRETVAFLAARELKGRRVGSPENRRAAEWLAKRFKEVGLAPAVEGSFNHDFKIAGISGRNVAGIIAAPDKAEEYVVVGAHFDGVGDVGKVHRPAADDNASGVAALLELAEALLPQRASLKRNIVIVAYDSEENGMWGSTAFVRDKVIPTDKTAFVIILDMIGGRFFPWQDKQVVAMGSEHSEFVRKLIVEKGRDRPTRVELVGTYVLEPAGPISARSDYRAYRNQEIPYLFFSIGTPWYYHTARDDIGHIDFQQAAEITRLVRDLLHDAARSNAEIDFIGRPKPEVKDLQQLHRLLGEILEHRKTIRLKAKSFERMQAMRESLAKKIASGRGNVLLAHRALMMVFAAARKSRPPSKAPSETPKQRR